MAQHTSIEDRIKQAYKAMAEGDIEKLLDLYTEDAVIQNPSQPPIVGIDSIRSFWAATFAQFDLQVVPEVQEVSDFGDILILRGAAVGKVVPKDGSAPVQVNTWFMQVYKRNADGQLHFWRGTNGPNPPTQDK